ncbi:MAG: PAS domain S-box protein [Oscillochloris sp.]|nr:PAS domain S-box protein [Oscillochloris sp.]
MPEQPQSPEHLERQYRLSELIIGHMSDGVIVIDADGTVVLYNQAAERLFGPLHPEAPTEDWASIYGNYLPDMLTPFPSDRLPITLALQGEESQDVTMFVRHAEAPDGHWVSVSGRPLRDSDGSLRGAMVVCRDITEQRWADERLQASEARFREIALNIPGAVFQFTISAGLWIMEYASERLAELVGRPVNELAADAYELLNVIHPDDRAACRASIDQAIVQLTPWHFSGRIVRPDGRIRYVHGDARPTRDSRGDILFLGMLSDVTAREEAQEAQRRAVLSEQIIAAQRAALEELSTPLIPITDSVMVMPLIGSVDSRRAQQVIEALLHGIDKQSAQIAILDITGVPVVDTQVANALIQAAQAARLLGVKVMLTGIRPEVAQTLVGLGVDLSGIMTHGSLQSGISAALRR